MLWLLTGLCCNAWISTSEYVLGMAGARTGAWSFAGSIGSASGESVEPEAEGPCANGHTQSYHCWGTDRPAQAGVADADILRGWLDLRKLRLSDGLRLES